MRQLDLFNSLFDNAAKQESSEEREVVINEKVVLHRVNKEEEQSPQVDLPPFSLVELAEEKYASEFYANTDSDTNLTNSALDPKESFKRVLENRVFFEKDLQATNTDLRIDDENAFAINEVGNDKDEDILKPILPKINAQASVRNGAVIFDDGKISVKVKTKTLVTPPPSVSDIAEEPVEKSKKEPQKRGRKPIKEIEAEVDLIEVPDDDVLFQKQYYAISEVAKWFRVNTSLLRFWENEFDILKPRKNRKGDRLFRPEDVKNLQIIYQLLRQRKYTIEGAKEYIKTNRKKADLELQLTQSLQKFKGFLLDLKANLG